MLKTTHQPYSRYSREAVCLLGKLIRRYRIEQGITVQALADRAGISRGLVQRIERGDMGCAIGSVFEVAAIVGVSLFDPSLSGIKTHVAEVDNMLRLLSRSVRPSSADVRDDF